MVLVAGPLRTLRIPAEALRPPGDGVTSLGHGSGTRPPALAISDTVSSIPIEHHPRLNPL